MGDGFEARSQLYVLRHGPIQKGLLSCDDSPIGLFLWLQVQRS